MPCCSIIIPVYNKASLTDACLQTLLGAPPGEFSFEIIVVDDGSQDVTQQLLAGYGDRIRVVTHAANAGFSTACNSGAAAAAGDFLVFLNNDTLPQDGWLDALARYAEAHPTAAVVGAKLLFPDDTIQHAGVVICQDRFPRHLYAGFPAGHPAVNKSRRFQVVTGGCALFRRGPFEQAGGFDIAFRNGYEDVDLCLRLGERGHESHYCHESTLYHLESVSDGRFKDGMENTRVYMQRWHERVEPDDFRYYLEDGLLSVTYHPTYPFQLRLSPLVGTVDGDGREWQAERLLGDRARQVERLLKDTVRLNVRVGEAELRAAGPRVAAPNLTAARTRPATPPPRLLCQGEIHWRSPEPSGRLVSLIIPVKNGAAKLRRLLPCLLGQATHDRLEIVAVDSGSTDESVELLRAAGATVVAIDPREFDHGLTRNLGAGYARGAVYVFLGQNTFPADERWLANLVAALDRDPQVAGVCSRVLPPDDADVLMRKDGHRDPSASPEPQVRAIAGRDKYRALDPSALRLLLNFHTVSAAVRATVFRRIPFRMVTTIGEDVLWAKEVLEAGFKIRHEPTSVVHHGHHFDLAELMRRNVDDGVANREIVGRRLEDADVVPGILHWARDDWRYLENEAGLGGEELEHWKMMSVLRRAAQVVGQWVGVNHDRMPGDLARLLSGVRQSRDGAEPRRPSLGAA
jgi:GT2 family glycosyltransferase